MSVEVIVTIVSKLICFTYLGDGFHPTYLYTSERTSQFVGDHEMGPIWRGDQTSCKYIPMSGSMGLQYYAIFTIHVYLTFIAWYIYLCMVYFCESMFPSRCFCLESTDVKPPNHRQPQTIGLKQVEVEKWSSEPKFERVRWPMNPEVFSPTFVPQVAVLGSGALAHDVTVQCVRAVQSLMSQQQSGALLPEILRWLPRFFFFRWKNPLWSDRQISWHKPMQLFNSPVVQKKSPKMSGWFV